MTVKYHYNKFPPTLKLDKELHQLVNNARTALGRYDGFLISFLDSKVLLSPLFSHEAVMSSRIEGTQSTLTEVLQFEGSEGTNKNFTESKKEELREILNYRSALELGIQYLESNKLALSQRLFKIMHKELMLGVRGENQDPGEYRKIPVWIGPDKGSIETARFIPIESQRIGEAMSNFEKYVHKNNDYDDLVKISILHVEFESIHPFLDGNGRLGRMFIPLYLYEKRIITSPSFYISSYFEKYRDNYYDLLLDVSKNGNWLDWCKFFVRGILEQANDNFSRAKKILDYYRELKDQIPKLSKSQYGIVALDYIFKMNYFNSTKFYEQADIPLPTAKRLLKVFVNKGILQCSKGRGNQPNFYIFRKLIDIAESN